MGKKRPSKTTPIDRFTYLWEAVWRKNSSAMAREIGVSHTAVAKVVRDGQPPGRHLLESVAGHAKVNPGWLLSGEGEPLLAEKTVSQSGGWQVPISLVLLPGPIAKHQELLSGKSAFTAGFYYRPTRYWYEVPADAAIVKRNRERVSGGDLVLIETDPKQVRRLLDESATYGLLCVIRQEIDSGVATKLARVSHCPAEPEEPEYWQADTFERGFDDRDIVVDIGIRLMPDGNYETYERLSDGKKRIGNFAHYRGVMRIQPDQVMGICVMMMRTRFVGPG